MKKKFCFSLQQSNNILDLLGDVPATPVINTEFNKPPGGGGGDILDLLGDTGGGSTGK